MPTPCPFCNPDPAQLIEQQELALALLDAYPVSPGHTLIITRRHVARLSETTPEERTELFDLLDKTQTQLEAQHSPDGFNIGINEGEAAGQTVEHLHIHLIPRYTGDVADPVGGVRGVIPHRQNYRREQDPVRDHDPRAVTPPHHAALIVGGDDALLPHLCAHINLARHVDIAVAFTMRSGLDLVEPHLRDLLDRGGRLRFLTGDYMDATEPRALRQLLDLSQMTPDRVHLRVFQAGERAFHPKAYLFHARDAYGVALVGSSNLSRAGLAAGVEWNYRVVTGRDRRGFAHVLDAFVRLFQHPSTVPLTADWIDAYEKRRRRPAPHVVPPEPDLPPPPEPHDIQRRALDALRDTREAGNKAGLVVLATGLGKTWLSAFDSFDSERVLFIAHREEILDQALRTYRRIRPGAHLGKFTGRERQADADVLFASIQTLGRLPNLRLFAADAFDYIVMDEFHHACASTYRRVIEHFEPEFFLGLTATPERTDGGDLLSLCNENLVFRSDIPEGIEEGQLCPFHYFGVPDEVDYANITWRSSRFDEEELTNHLATHARARNALEQYRSRGGRRTLAFCCSQRHADFMREFFRDEGIACAAVHAGESSDPRAASLERLTSRELEVVFCVDMFNEGVDLPNVDTILMLRPTESKILWLQQFGRGLRQTEQGDKTLKVIDYIGNHRTFLNKPTALMQAIYKLDPGIGFVRDQLNRVRHGEAELPPGCSVTYDMEAIEVLERLFPTRRDGGEVFYREFREEHERRPFASEVYHSGHNPRVLARDYGGWVGFVEHMGDLADTARELRSQRAGRFLAELDGTQMSKSYKMIVLRAMLRRDALPGKLTLDELTEGFAAEARRDQHLRADVTVSLEDHAALRRLIVENPVNAWTGGRGTGGEAYFELEDDIFRCTLDIPDDQREAFQELTRELVEWRLADYLDRARGAGAQRIVCKVSHAGGRPILFLPDRQQQSGIPEGTTRVTVEGEAHEADFVKIAVNVMRKEGEEGNVLPEVLRRWFGVDAGQPGTAHRVAFLREEGGYRLEPLRPGTDGPELWKTYKREEIPPIFGLEFTPGAWNQGFIRKPGHIFLLVTLEKGSMQEAHRYEDRFLSPTEFQWQSQNQTTQESKAGRAIRNHEADGTLVHLFVRPTKMLANQAAPFRYCGEVTFARWEGERPITVWCTLPEPVPAGLAGLLGIDH